MARQSPIVVGSIVVATVILCAEGYALFGGRRHHAVRPAVAEPEPEPLPAAAPPPVVPQASRPVFRPAPAEVRQVEPVAEPPPPIAEALASPAVDAGAAPDGGLGPMLSRRMRKWAEHRRHAVRVADERVFETLNLAESTRTEIRRIDEAYEHTLEALNQVAPAGNGGAPGHEADLNAEQTRREAIGRVLDPDTLRAFDAAERSAMHDERNQFRAKWMQGL